MPLTLEAIRRYPVKGLSAEGLAAVDLTAGRALPWDRRFAILTGPAAQELDQDGWRPKSDFFTLVQHEKLAALSTTFDEETATLVIHRGGKPVSRGRLDQPMGRMLIEQFFAAYLKGAAPGAPKLADAGDGAYTDTKRATVSILNLASVRDFGERIARQTVDPGRFRANLWIDGAAPWSERDWMGKRLTIGGAVLEVVKPTGRCAATEVDPASGARDLNTLSLMERGLGHTICGVYAVVEQGGRIAPGDPVDLIAPGDPVDLVD